MLVLMGSMVDGEDDRLEMLVLMGSMVDGEDMLEL